MQITTKYHAWRLKVKYVFMYFPSVFIHRGKPRIKYEISKMDFLQINIDCVVVFLLTPPASCVCASDVSDNQGLVLKTTKTIQNGIYELHEFSLEIVLTKFRANHENGAFLLIFAHGPQFWIWSISLSSDGTVLQIFVYMHYHSKFYTLLTEMNNL